MNPGAHVDSLAAIEAFRARLIVFVDKVKRSLDHTGETVNRARGWLDGECGVRWTQELKKRRQSLEQAEAELLTARNSAFMDNVMTQKTAVRRAEQAVEEAETKLRAVRHWSRQFDTVFLPLLKRVESLRQSVDHDLPKAAAYLREMTRILSDYSERGLPVADANAAPPGADQPSDATAE